jgi:hypothetical protein
LSQLITPSEHLGDLDTLFDGNEIWNAIKRQPAHKAPGLAVSQCQISSGLLEYHEALLTAKWPISLIYLVAKLFTKTLSLCLAPKLDTLVSPYQNAFIAGTQSVRLHQLRQPRVLLKLDLAHAFDSISWPFSSTCSAARIQRHIRRLASHPSQFRQHEDPDHWGAWTTHLAPPRTVTG